ncbi:MAG TPA: bifunctional phosphoribosylaminoimidazolecarboxamide formyltransferase/IMP cyclohydrolase [Dehalococcoidia bacterium]|nr:bifunctional phosphoribosylaminoimidazolecarboxamide formyltransferase/IMP cyclohydrolase [Dehalococcoidia bacterium]
MIALISVSDKTGINGFAFQLAELGYDIYSTGGTQKALAEVGLPVHSISALTGFPEILDGRVKTLHPLVHGGILARRDKPEHLEELKRNQIPPIDLVCVNLYPFVETVSRPDVTLEEALENIDIGGPALLRAAAKNFPHVLVVVDPADYDAVIDLLRQGEAPQEVRQGLAAKAFQHVASYDTAIAQYLRGEEMFPEELTIALSKVTGLRYGENPHQQAALYRERRVGLSAGIVGARQLHGKELSYNNILDADGAWAVVSDFAEPAVAIIKHTNPCGLAVREELVDAFQHAFLGDPLAAFGGIVAVNRKIDERLASAIREAKHPTSGQRLFLEVIIAPGFTQGALEALGQSANLRLLEVAAGQDEGLAYRQVSGGFLAQQPDRYPDDEIELQTVTRRAPTEEELRDLRFAWKACKHVKSNAITVVRERALLGIGAGQVSRVSSVELALRATGERASGAVLASDAFFPFADNVEVAARAGITAIIQPGGSMRDEDSIRACDDNDIAMVFTGVRHFRH